jgi:RNA polymerase sigma-70 factor (ECF subfamily)
MRVREASAENSQDPDVAQEGGAPWILDAVRTHEAPLVRYAARILGDVERAREVVQETFLRLCSRASEDVRDHLAEWLFTVCRNRALDVKRKEKRMSTRPDDELPTRASDEPGPVQLLERREAADSVLRAIDGLSSNQQEVIRLKFQNGLSYKEISRITELSVSNVGFLIHTGLKTLRERLTRGAGPVGREVTP